MDIINRLDTKIPIQRQAAQVIHALRNDVDVETLRAVNCDVDELIRRLRGEYRIPITDGLGAVGAGEEPNNPKEFVRRFQVAPINIEAADEIERLIKHE